MEKIVQFFGYSSTSISKSELTNPDKFTLYGNYPNPFNNQTKIQFSIPMSTNVELNIFNSVGQLIFHDSWKSSGGTQNYHLNTFNWASGVYFYTLSFNEQLLKSKFVIMK